MHDDSKHFEFLLLKAMQAGLSWLTSLKRREGYRNAFANYIKHLSLRGATPRGNPTNIV